MIGEPGCEAEGNETVEGLRGKEFGKQSKDLCACHVSDRSYTLDPIRRAVWMPSEWTDGRC